ncbi:MAG: ABC transporter substrate-binding protein [Alphaproteobacteria bacterium]|nr:ABC transporter substrate-binding protein [Alphaproteobacteria bacterium]TAD87384.1 MAG: ABC transporter substrate-binding protein [Alphaproteobacteria bacterium]
MRTAVIGFSALLLATAAGWLPQAHAQTPRDTIVMAKSIDDMITADPAESFEFSGSEVVTNVYDRLLIADPLKRGELTPQLAQSWEVSADGLTYTFKMKPGLKFHSGNPITAADAAYSLQRAVILNKSPAFILTQFGFTKDNVAERIRAVDATTLTIQIEKPVAPTFFLNCMTATVASVVDSRLVQSNAGTDMGNTWLKTNSAGSGPFRLRNWTASQSVTLEANREWHGGAPKVNRVVIRHVSEPQAQRLGLEKGDFDIARDLGKDQIAAISNNQQLKIVQGDLGYIMYVALNQRHPILSKPEVREAIKWLIDYEGIERDLVRGTYLPHQSFLPKGFLGAIEDKPYSFNVERARALLARAGHPNGFSITFDVRARQPETDIGQAIQASLARGGIRVEIIQGDGRQVLTKYRARNHDMIMVQWGPDYFDPHTNAETFAMNEDNSDNARSKTLAWRNAWDIPDMTRRTAAAVAERDGAVRTATYQALQREHQQVSPFAPLLQQIEVAVMRQNVNGFVIGGTFGSTLYYQLTKN